MANPFSFDLDRLDAAGIMEARERNQDRTKKRMQDIHALIVNRRLDKQFANNPTSSEAFLARSQAFQGYDPTRAQQFLALGIDAKKEENRALEAELDRQQRLAIATAQAAGKEFQVKNLTKPQLATNSVYLIQLWDEQQPGFWAGLFGEEKKLPELTSELHREFNGHFQDVKRDSRGQLSDQAARLLATQLLLGNFGSDSTENGEVFDSTEGAGSQKGKIKLKVKGKDYYARREAVWKTRNTGEHRELWEEIKAAFPNPTQATPRQREFVNRVMKLEGWE